MSAAKSEVATHLDTSSISDKTQPEQTDTNSFSDKSKDQDVPVVETEKDLQRDLESGHEIHLVTSNDSTEFEKSRGVRRIENVSVLMKDADKGKLITILFSACLLIISWARALDQSTTMNYSVPAASSFNRHSMVSTVDIATSIIGSVLRPILAKISDITSRPWCLAISLVIYTVGTIVAASSGTIAAYVVGEVLTTVGSTGISFLVSVICADFTTLQWRGVIHGIIASPFIINTWFSGLIVDAILAKNWRWGFGMFAILMPVVCSPAIYVLHHFEHKAQKLVPKVEKEKKSLVKVLVNAFIEADAFGLLLLGFGWSLLLLPFSLYTYANDGWKNPSIIAMVVVGAVLLVSYMVYEMNWAPFPSFPKRILYNKTFVTAAIMDFVYQFCGGLRGSYLSSVVWITKDISNRDWTYYNNTLTMTLCLFGIVAGVICRITHRYKYLQISGLLLLILGYGLIVRPQGKMATLASFIMGQAIIGTGGSFTVIGTQTSSQASVPHQDLSLVIALLGLVSSIGAAVGSAISAPIWTSKLPGYMREFLPASVTDAEVFNYYSNASSLRALTYDDPIRQGAIKAYAYTSFYLFVPPVGLQVISLIAGCFQTNYYLGDTHNAVEDQNGKDPINPDEEKKEIPTTLKGKIAYLFR